MRREGPALFAAVILALGYAAGGAAGVAVAVVFLLFLAACFDEGRLGR